MSFNASHRGARISASKVRPLANLVRGKFVDEALDILRYQPHRGARLVENVIKSAMANAQDPDQNSGQITNTSELFISSVRVDCGPMFKRVRPRARGMAFMIKKRMSHIHVEIDAV
jgi:large subunit ribosomal protein L22